MKKKIFKKIFISITIVIFSLVFLMFVLLTGFKIIFSQKKIESFEVNSSTLKRHILIASQGSKFKDQLVKNLIEELNKENVYIKVIDVSLLDNIKSSEWESIIIINAVESSKYNKNVNQFIQNNFSNNNIILIATSGSGKFKIQDYYIDAISTASKIKDIDNIKAFIIDKVDL
jgi:hypothetical protein